VHNLIQFDLFSAHLTSIVMVMKEKKQKKCSKTTKNTAQRRYVRPDM